MKINGWVAPRWFLRLECNFIPTKIGFLAELRPASRKVYFGGPSRKAVCRRHCLISIQSCCGLTLSTENSGGLSPWGPYYSVTASQDKHKLFVGSLPCGTWWLFRPKFWIPRTSFIVFHLSVIPVLVGNKCVCLKIMGSRSLIVSHEFPHVLGSHPPNFGQTHVSYWLHLLVGSTRSH